MHNVLSKELKQKLRSIIDSQEFLTPISMCLHADNKEIAAHNELIFSEGFAHGVFATVNRGIDILKAEKANSEGQDKTEGKEL